MLLVLFYLVSMERNQIYFVNFYEVDWENDIEDYMKILSNQVHLENDLYHLHHSHY